MNLNQIPVAVLVVCLISCTNGSDHRVAKADIITINESYDTTLYFLNGEKIFQSDCNACHVAKDRLHNHLEGVVQRVGDGYLKLYLTRQDSLIRAKDKYAVNIKEAWGNLGNSHNFQYSEKQLQELIEYLR